jgi:hypothetical protein
MKLLARHLGLAALLFVIGGAGMFWGGGSLAAAAWGKERSAQTAGVDRGRIGRIVHWGGFALAIGGFMPILLLPSALAYEPEDE